MLRGSPTFRSSYVWTGTESGLNATQTVSVGPFPRSLHMPIVNTRKKRVENFNDWKDDAEGSVCLRPSLHSTLTMDASL